MPKIAMFENKARQDGVDKKPKSLLGKCLEILKPFLGERFSGLQYIEQDLKTFESYRHKNFNELEDEELKDLEATIKRLASNLKKVTSKRIDLEKYFSNPIVKSYVPDMNTLGPQLKKTHQALIEARSRNQAHNSKGIGEILKLHR